MKHARNCLRRLANVRSNYNQKYEKIKVEKFDIKCKCQQKKRIKRIERTKVNLEKFGKCIASVEYNADDEEYRKAIEKFCTNVNKIILNTMYPICLKKFVKLDEVEIVGDVNVEKVEEIFQSVPHLKSVACHKVYIKLLDMLPKLESLWLYNVFCDDDFQKLQHLQRLTKLSFGSSNDCNENLRRLAVTNLGRRLIELNLRIPYNDETLDILKRFKTLQVLSLVHPFKKQVLSEVVLYNLPNTLKCIQLKEFKISADTFWIFLVDLPRLTELSIEDITSDNGNAKGLNHTDVGNELIAKFRKAYPQRTMTIIYEKPCDSAVPLKCILSLHASRLQMTDIRPTPIKSYHIYV